MSRDDFPRWEDTPEGFAHWMKWVRVMMSLSFSVGEHYCLVPTR